MFKIGEGIVTAKGRWSIRLLLLLSFNIFINQNIAQAQVVFPPSHNNINTAGVDLKRGSFNYSHADISIGNGPPARAPTLIRYHSSEFVNYQGMFGTGTSHNYDIKAYVTTEAGQTVVVIQQGFSTVKFTRIGSEYIPQNRDGSVLTRELVDIIYYYRYKLRDGTVYLMLPGTPCTTAFGSCYYPLAIQTPHEGTIFLGYDLAGTTLRLRSVISSIGRALYMTYASSTDLKVQSIAAVNLTDTYCTTTCTPPTSAPKVTYSYTGSSLTGFTDALGKTTSYSVDGAGRLQSVRLPANPSVDYVSVGYDANGRVSSQTWNSKSWSYSFTPSSGEITQAQVTDPLSGETTTQFGTQPVPASITDAEGKTTQFGYDAYFRLTSVTKPLGNITQFTIDGRGNVTKITEKPNPSVTPAPADRITDFAFDATCSNQFTCNQPNSVITASGTTTFSYDSVDGKLLKVTLPIATTGANQGEVRFSYTDRQPYIKNSSGSPTTSIPAGSNVYLLRPIPMVTGTSTCPTSSPSACPGAADEIKTVYAYGPTGVALNNLDLTSRTFDPAGLNLSWSYTYDLIGNTKTITDPRAAVTSFDYDSERRPVKTVQPNPGSGAPETVIGYTDDGRQDRVASKIGSSWLVSCALYSSAGLKTADYGPAVTSANTICPTRGDTIPEINYAYDDAGRLADQIELLPAGQGGNRQTATEYYANGWVKKVTKAAGSAAAQEYAFYTYTGNGMPATMKAQRTTTPDVALTSYEYNGFDELAKLRYPDATNGAVSSTTDFETFGYDAVGNMTKRVLRCAGGSGCPEINYAYDALSRVISKDVPEAGQDVTYSYDLLNRILSASLPSPNSALSVAWSYDKLGRVLSESSQGKTIAHSYDAAGAWDRIQWPGGVLDLRRDFDVLGRMTGIKPNAGGSNLVTYGWDQLSRRTGVSYLNGTTTSYAYDDRSWLSQLKQDLGGSGYDVQWDFADQVVGGTTLRGYSRAGQLLRARRDNDAYAWTNNYNVNRTYQSNALDQYTRAGSWTPTWDARGNLASYDGWTYTHDSQNRLTGANGQRSATLAYDAVGRLARITIGGVTTDLLYSGDQLIAEYDGAGTVLRRYVPGTGVDEPVIWYEGSGLSQPRYLHADRLGSIVTASDASGNGLFVNAYGPYGEPGLNMTGRFGYTGQQRLAELGLYYFKARFYSPKLGRFLEADPIGTEGGNNLYAYVSNDPVNRIDPWGLQDFGLPPVGNDILAGVSSGIYSPGLYGSLPGSSSSDALLIVNGLRNQSLPSIAMQSAMSLSLPQSSDPDEIVVTAYWRKQQAAGNPIARLGLQFCYTCSADWSTAFARRSLIGAIAHQPINGRYPNAAQVRARYGQIRVALMNADQAARLADASGIPGLLSAGQIYDYHVAVYSSFGLSSSTFGGSYFTGSRSEAIASSWYWCPGCDR